MRVEANVSPESCRLASAGFSAAGSVSTTVPELIRGAAALGCGSRAVRRSPGAPGSSSGASAHRSPGVHHGQADPAYPSRHMQLERPSGSMAHSRGSAAGSKSVSPIASRIAVLPTCGPTTRVARMKPSASSRRRRRPDPSGGAGRPPGRACRRHSAARSWRCRRCSRPAGRRRPAWSRRCATGRRCRRRNALDLAQAQARPASRRRWSGRWRWARALVDRHRVDVHETGRRRGDGQEGLLGRVEHVDGIGGGRVVLHRSGGALGARHRLVFQRGALGGGEVGAGDHRAVAHLAGR